MLTVSELTAAIRDCLESKFFEVWVEGEVSNYRPWNGLIYFTLKDAGAQLRVVMFRTAVRRLKFAIEDGTHVLARGRVSVYDPRGEYQLVCEHVEPKGLGALQLAFEQLKKRLTAEGLFDPARKRPLPVLPHKIGIVTSLDGAALRDIIRVISGRHANVHLVVRPTRVQGEGAAEDIARGLTAISRVPGVDVVIVGRGGGSIEDLWAFNEEVVARAIAACSVPVISAVGHDVDWTIADLVADVRAATPSNAAELVVARKDEFHARIARCAERLRAALYARDRDTPQPRPWPHDAPWPRGRSPARGLTRAARGRPDDGSGACDAPAGTGPPARSALDCSRDSTRAILAGGSGISARGSSSPTGGSAPPRRGASSVDAARSPRSRRGWAASARWRSSVGATPSAGRPTAGCSCARRRRTRGPTGPRHPGARCAPLRRA